MKILNRYLIKELSTPFITTLFILIFVLLSQFILKNLDRFLGKGLSIATVFKFLFLNSAWIISLAIPMAVLVTTLMTFGKLSANNEITAFKASGIRYVDLFKPAISFSLAIILFLIPYNLWVLPEMNHNVRTLSYKISKNRPDIEFHENLLNHLSDKVIYLGDRISSHKFSDIKIFNNTKINNYSTIMAENGEFISLEDGIILDLNHGSIHENTNNEDEYRKTYFENYKLAIPFEDLGFANDKKLKKQEREMNIALLFEKNRYFRDRIKKTKSKSLKHTNQLDSLNAILSSIQINSPRDKLNSTKLKNSINIITKKQNKNNKLIPMYNRELNKYNVEIHKKFSVPFACIIFVLLGMPLGILSRKGNMSVSISISLGIFIIYWCFLIMGEDLADKTIINPTIAMWSPNIVLGIISYYLYTLIKNENKKININLFKWSNKK